MSLPELIALPLLAMTQRR